MEVLLRLAPASLAGHDRLACLHYRRGDMDRAAALLAGWRRLNPADPWPVIRQAIIEQQRGNALARAEAIDEALGLAQGNRRAAVAFLGARLALKEAPPTPAALVHAAKLLQDCLSCDPNHLDALWCLAVVRSATGDREGLAAQRRRWIGPM